MRRDGVWQAMADSAVRRGAVALAAGALFIGCAPEVRYPLGESQSSGVNNSGATGGVIAAGTGGVENTAGTVAVNTGGVQTPVATGGDQAAAGTGGDDGSAGGVGGGVEVGGDGAQQQAQCADLEAAALAILDGSCAMCHNAGFSSGGIGDILVASEQVDSGMIVPGDGAGSRVVETMYEGDPKVMPPVGVGELLDQASIDEVADWIDNCVQ